MPGELVIPGAPQPPPISIEDLARAMLIQGKKAGVPAWVPIIGSALLAGASTWFTMKNDVDNVKEKIATVQAEVKEARAEAVSAKEFARDRGDKTAESVASINTKLAGIEADVRSLLRDVQAQREAVKAIEAAKKAG